MQSSLIFYISPILLFHTKHHCNQGILDIDIVCVFSRNILAFQLRCYRILVVSGSQIAYDDIILCLKKNFISICPVYPKERLKCSFTLALYDFICHYDSKQCVQMPFHNISHLSRDIEHLHQWVLNPCSQIFDLWQNIWSYRLY